MDLEQMMTTALVSGSNDHIHAESKEVSLDHKKKFICNNIKKLTRTEKLDIGFIIVRYCGLNTLKDTACGCMANLELLDSKIINDIYISVLLKLRSKDKN